MTTKHCEVQGEHACLKAVHGKDCLNHKYIKVKEAILYFAIYGKDRQNKKNLTCVLAIFT